MAVPLMAGAQQKADATDAVVRGARVFATYCVVCHGAQADGNGRAAELFTPRPANLRTSTKSDTYMTSMIRLGGEALGRSSSMPAWGPQLEEAQIADVVSFIRSVNVHADSTRDRRE